MLELRGVVQQGGAGALAVARVAVRPAQLQSEINAETAGRVHLQTEGLHAGLPGPPAGEADQAPAGRHPGPRQPRTVAAHRAQCNKHGKVSASVLTGHKGHILCLSRG